MVAIAAISNTSYKSFTSAARKLGSAARRLRLSKAWSAAEVKHPTSRRMVAYVHPTLPTDLKRRA